MVGIYKIENLVNKKVYIGQSVDLQTRFQSHANCSRRNLDTHLYRAIKKYGWESFSISILEECLVEELDDKERYYIAFYASIDPEKGYNKESGGSKFKKLSEETKQKMSEKAKGEGNPFFGKKHSDETKERMSKIRQGRSPSDQAKKNISEGLKGHKISEKTKKAISESNKGKKASEEAKRRMSESRKGHPVSEETRQKLSAALKGKPTHMLGTQRSEETKRKIAEGNKRAWQRRKQNEETIS